MKTIPCYKPKNKEDHDLMTKLLYSLGYKMGDAETPDICAKMYSSSWKGYNFLQDSSNFDAHLFLRTIENPLIFNTLGEFIDAAIEFAKPKDIIVKLQRGVDVTFVNEGAKFNANGCIVTLSINDIETLYVAAQKYKQQLKGK